MLSALPLVFALVVYGLAVLIRSLMVARQRSAPARDQGAGPRTSRRPERPRREPSDPTRVLARRKVTAAMPQPTSRLPRRSQSSQANADRTMIDTSRPAENTVHIEPAALAAARRYIATIVVRDPL